MSATELPSMKGRLAMIEHWRADARLRFLVVGGWNTLFGYLAYVALYQLLNREMSYLLIGLLAHSLAVINAFTCHRYLVFGSRGSLLADFLRFNLSQVTVLGVGLVVLWCLVDGLGVAPLLAQAAVTAGAVVLSYLAHRYFTFAK